MNIGSTGIFSHDEFMRNVKTIQPGQREAGAEDLKSYMSLNLPTGQASDKFDYYVNINSQMNNRSLVSFGDTSLEMAVRQVNTMSFNNDGTANITSYEDKLQELRTNGLSKDIDWKAVDKYHLSLLSNFSLDYEYSVEDSIKELASSYAVLKNQIEQNFKGDELNKQLSELDKIFNQNTETLAASFSDSVSGFLTGIEGEKEKLYASVKNAVTELANNYSAFIHDNKDYANLKGTEDEWLSGHYRYMSTQLQSAYQQDVSADASLYNAKELDSIGKFATTGNLILGNENGYTTDEEEFGFRLGLMALKADYLADSSGVSQSYKDALMRQVNKTIETSIASIDRAYQYEREHPVTGDEEALFAPLDKDAIYMMINSVRDSYAQTKDLLGAIYKGAQVGQETFSAKQFDSEHIDMSRYGYGGGKFWDRMYESQTVYGNIHTSNIEQIYNSFNDLFGKDFAARLNAYA